MSAVSRISVSGFDHIVLCVANVDRTLAFYKRVLGMRAREERPGKWSLEFGAGKISLQQAGKAPAMASGTVPGSGNFCLLSDVPVEEWRAHLEREAVIVIDQGLRDGAVGTIDSLYFRDLDDNLVEVANLVERR